jgi:lactate dehydrogenase-like 2-hydroxyacid dehydrogenase
MREVTAAFTAMERTSEGIKEECYYGWVALQGYKLMENYLDLGFKLDLYSDYELEYINWYLSEIICHSIVKMYSYFQDVKKVIMKSTKKKQKDIQCTYVKDISCYQIKFLVSRGNSVAIRLFAHEGQIKTPKMLSDNIGDRQNLRYTHRFAPFMYFKDPNYIAWDHYKTVSDSLVKETSLDTAIQLFKTAKEKITENNDLSTEFPELPMILTKNIIVCNVPDYGTNDVADHSFALLLSLVRGVDIYNHQLKRNMQWEWTTAGELHRLTDLTFGIIGLGRIGTASALRAKSFGMNVVYYDPYVPDGKDKALQITRVHFLNELLEKADIISLHTALTDETKYMVNKDFFKYTKKNSILINTSRGQIIDLDALYNALLGNVLQAAGLDVLPKEPPDSTHSLIQAWRAEEDWLAGRLLITPHAAFYNHESFIEMRTKAAEEALRILEGGQPKNQVNS